ncbi:MAG: TolC family protein [Gammaproteobacteria bacterium]|nr:TolC family protein [Gammaproteobacteria bacterium]NNJ51221.1 TolC family protein [Gammaproteobacteria bacterium]
MAICFHAPLLYAEPLPSPLSLSKALSLANNSHPELLLADANLAYALSERESVGSSNDIDAYVELAPYTASPSTNDKFTNDSYLRFSVSKTIYDFGYSDYLEDSADEAVLSQQLNASAARNKSYLNIMRLYFGVLLADLHFAAVDEEMTSLYVKFDKLRERHSLGMVSDVTLAESESIYRELADQRKSAELEQQSSRWRLAIALNRPDDIPGELIRPDLPQLDRTVPELSELLDEAFNNNLTLTALEHAMLADRAALKATQQQYGPTLAAGLELNEYQRKLPGKNDASIGVTLRIPLLNGSRSQAEVARAAAKLSSSQANYDLAKHSLRQNLSDLVRRLELLNYKRTTDELRLDSTSLTLDRNRARYELEMQTTLGDSMAKYTNAEWLSAKNDYDIATTWAQIEILTGKKLYQGQE